MDANLSKPKIFVLGNHFFSELNELYELRHATQSTVAKKIGIFGDINNYFSLIDFHPELFFFTDESLPLLLSGLERVDIPLVGYLIDSHLHNHWHKYFVNIFDHCFVAQKNHYQEFNMERSRCSWLPLFARDHYLDIPRDTDVCFVGTLDAGRNPERVVFIESFQQYQPLMVVQGAFQKIFNTSRIILNQSVRDDINFRVFEAMSCGGMLLTDSVGNGLDEMFKDGTHLVVYEKGNVMDAVQKATYYLEHEQECQSIAMAGYLETVRNHSSHMRLRTVNSVFESLLKNRTELYDQRGKTLKETYMILAFAYAGALGNNKLAETYIQMAKQLEKYS